ncbi:unnamed protein product, partial [Meganyctiphanes norvegica]
RTMKILLIFGALVAVASAQRQTRNGGRSCNDRHQSCRSWSDIGECQKNPNFMNDNCKKSCNNCPSAVVNPAFTTPPPVTRSPAVVNPAFTTLPPVTRSPGTKDLCSEMNGVCVEPIDDCRSSQAMRIYNKALPVKITQKYCGANPVEPACCAPSGRVFTVDIENGLAFIFNNTLIYNSWKPKTGRELVRYTAGVRSDLLAFLMILKKYLKAPHHIQDHTKNFILKVEDYVKKTNTINAIGLQQEFIKIQDSNCNAYLSARQASVSCHNIDTSKTDCYVEPWLASCGFWNMFHTMTVAANDTKNPLEVINAIRGFMSNFFFCGLCRGHFLGMYKQTIGSEATYPGSVDTLDKAILWLWCAHNAVNQEWTDRHHSGWPKHHQFPLHQVCPRCWNSLEETNCFTLFCKGPSGPNKCFEAKFDDSTTTIIYENFSVPAVLEYLKDTYSRNSSQLNTNLRPGKFDTVGQCPNQRKCFIYG